MAYTIFSILFIISISSVLGSPVIYERYEDSFEPRKEHIKDGLLFYPDAIYVKQGDSDNNWKTEMIYLDVIKDKDDFNPRTFENEPVTAEPLVSYQRRERRSPQEPGKRGSVSVSAGHTRGQHGQPSQSSVRTDYNHNLWRGRNGATLDANAYHQRNWGGGRRNDYGGGLSLRVPF